MTLQIIILSLSLIVLWNTIRDKKKLSQYEKALHPQTIKVTRSIAPVFSDDLIMCGNCRGTGQDGFGIMPDSFECEACEGRGYCKIDPNAQYVSFEEFIKKYRTEK